MSDLGDEPLLMAVIDAQGGQWRQRVVDLIEQADPWFSLQEIQEKALTIKISATTETCVRFTERSNKSLVIDIRKEHGPLGVLFGMALAKALGEKSVVLSGQSYSLGVFNNNVPELSGMDSQQRSAVAVALGLKPAPLIAKNTAVRGLFN